MTTSCSVNDARSSQCLKFTKDCTGCLPDSTAQPGELICWCSLSPPSLHSTHSATGVIDFDPVLLTDTDRDGVPDYEARRAISIGNGVAVRPAQVTLVNSTSLVWRWEDNWSSGAADHNDFIATAEVRHCGPPRFELDALGTDPECGSTCGATCPPDWVGSDGSKFRVTGSAQIEEQGTETPYEMNGRKMLIDVALHSDFQAPTLGGASLTAALCPELYFDFVASPASYAGGYGAVSCGDGSCNSTGNAIGPTCTSVPGHTTNRLPIAISSFGNSTANSCASDPTADASDVFVVSESTVCGPDTLMRHFELRLDQVDAVIANPSNSFSTQSFSQIADRLFEVRVNVFVDLSGAGKAFQCPAGVGAFLSDRTEQPTVEPVQPGMAKLLIFRFRKNPVTNKWDQGFLVNRWTQ
jgi:hypothetical protein